jgi:hypothetical protein
LEANKFKEEFLIDYLTVVVESFVRWDSAPGFVAPFLENRRYAPEYQTYFHPRVVPAFLPAARPPMIRWGAAVAAA